MTDMHTSESFVLRTADKIKLISPETAADLENIVIHYRNELIFGQGYERQRLEYFVGHWPV